MFRGHAILPRSIGPRGDTRREVSGFFPVQLSFFGGLNGHMDLPHRF